MHHELPQRLNLEWYRKSAKQLLRAYRAGDAEAVERAAEALGERNGPRLSDAQHVIAVEHGFSSWADLKRWVEEHDAEPPVGRIGRAPVSYYEDRARKLVAGVRGGDEDALRRVRANVPRLFDFAGNGLSERDAKLAVAREYGFPTWRDLVFYVQKAIREYEGQREGTAAVIDALAAIRSGDLGGLRDLLDRNPGLVGDVHVGAWTTLLEAIAQPDVFGDSLEIELGVDPRIVELLIARGSELRGPIGLAACFNRAELVRILLDAGAPIDASEVHGITPLQSAIYHGAEQAGDLLAAAGLVPDALYVAAATDRVDQLEKWFDGTGALRPEALKTRPNLADVGWPPMPPPKDDPHEVLGEAMALAAYNGRIHAMENLLPRGANVNGTAHGLTGLHFTVIKHRLAVARWLVEHGADLSLEDEIHRSKPLGWAEHSAKGSPIHGYLAGVTR